MRVLLREDSNAASWLVYWGHHKNLHDGDHRARRYHAVARPPYVAAANHVCAS